MRHSLRLTIAAASLAALAACSLTAEQPALSDDLKQDLAKAGGSDVTLAGSTTSRLEVVSAAERTNGATAAPKSPTVAKAPSALRGRTAGGRIPRRRGPAARRGTDRGTGARAGPHADQDAFSASVHAA